MSGLEVRALRVEDQPQALTAHGTMAREGFPFLLGWDDHDGDFASFVAAMERWSRGEDLPEGYVPATMLVGMDRGVLVGRVHVRHHLTPALERYGGHVGYGVLPAHRGRGHATVLLRRGLALLAELGVDEALVTCDEDNPASRTVIERCGGHLRDLLDRDDGGTTCRYDVPTG